MATERGIVALFARCQHLWGHRWVSVYGPACDAGGNLTASARHWLADLRNFDDAQVAAAVERLLARRPEWPPTVPEWLSACEGLPTLSEVLDRQQDYGPLCGAIRARMDWWNLDQMPNSRRLQVAEQAVDQAVSAIRRAGQHGLLPTPLAATSVTASVGYQRGKT